MSFLNPPVTISSVFLFLSASGKTSTPSLIGEGGVKHPSKGRRRGSIWGQKAPKRPLPLSSRSYVTACSAPDGGRAESLGSPPSGGFRLSPRRFSEISSSPFSRPSTTASAHPPRPSSSPAPLPTSPSLFMCPCLSFHSKGRGRRRHFILGYRPVPLIIRSSSLASLRYFA